MCEAVFVSRDKFRQITVEFETDTHVLAPQAGLEQLHLLVDQFGQRERRRIEVETPRIEAAKIDRVVDERQNITCLCVGIREELTIGSSGSLDSSS
ncbi:MAG: hypothetical protein AAF317_10575 [Pseudomonadota bacterium]